MSFPYHKSHVSPLALHIAIHYATRCNDFENMWSPAQITIFKQFVLQGILRTPTDAEREAGWDNKYIATDKCRAWVELLCKTPFPIQMWVDPRTEEMV